MELKSTSKQYVLHFWWKEWPQFGVKSVLCLSYQAIYTQLTTDILQIKLTRKRILTNCKKYIMAYNKRLTVK